MDGQRTPLLQKGSAQGPRVCMNNSLSRVEPPIPDRGSTWCHNFDHIGTDFIFFLHEWLKEGSVFHIS